MKKVTISLLALFLLFSFTVATTSAAEPEKAQPKPFTGTFAGLLHGSNNSSAIMTLELEQKGNINMDSVSGVWVHFVCTKLWPGRGKARL